MSIFRNPKGTYVRSTPDWFALNSARGGHVQAPGAGFSAIELFNEGSVPGASLFVYGISFEEDKDFPVAFYTVKQGPLTTPIGPCSPVDSEGATPPGTICSGVLPAGPPDGSAYLNAFAGAPPAFAGWPVAIVRPHDSLVVHDWDSNTLLWVGFYYCWLQF